MLSVGALVAAAGVRSPDFDEKPPPDVSAGPPTAAFVIPAHPRSKNDEKKKERERPAGCQGVRAKINHRQPIVQAASAALSGESVLWLACWCEA